jgi:Spy/CpxP family protein refolding chaperone
MTKRNTAIGMAGAVLILLLHPLLASAQAVEEKAPAEPQRRMRMAADEVMELTAEQRKQIEEFRKARNENSKALRERMTKLQAERRELMKDPAANTAKLEGLIDEIYRIRADQSKGALRSRREWEKIFTPEQLEKMKNFRRASVRRDLRPGRDGMRAGRIMARGLRGRGMMTPRFGRSGRFGAWGRGGVRNLRPFIWRRR